MHFELSGGMNKGQRYSHYEMEDKIDHLFYENLGRANEINVKIADFAVRQEDTIHNLLEMMLDNRMTKYEDVTKAFKKFFYEENLLTMLDNKAEACNLKELDVHKASRLELQATNRMIENLNVRVKHLANVQHEFAATLQPVSTEIN